MVESTNFMDIVQLLSEQVHAKAYSHDKASYGFQKLTYRHIHMSPTHIRKILSNLNPCQQNRHIRYLIQLNGIY